MDDHIVTTKLSKGIDADLSEAAFDGAVELLRTDKPKHIICCPNSAVIAARLAEQHGLQVTVLPKDVFIEDSWVVLGSYMSVYSKGA